MAIFGGQKGFWVKRVDDASPIFISVGGMDVPDADVEKSKNEWSKRDYVQWAGDDPNSIYTDIATGNVAAFSKATPDVVENTYLDELLSQVEEESQTSKTRALESNRLLVQQMKEGRELWNKDLEKTYGRALEKANVNIYERGIQDSGIKSREIEGLSEEKTFQTEQRNLLETQRQQIASENLKARLENIAQSEKRARLSYKSPYADYSYQ